MKVEIDNRLVIGIDGAVPSVVEKYSKMGLLPNITELIKKGTWAENCLPPFPNVTPICWATVATGASPGTHGVTADLYDWKIPIDKTYRHKGYSSRSVKAETIWEAAERSGARTLLVSFPTSWPPKTKKGVQIGTTDTSVTDGSFGIKNQLFSTENISGSIKIGLKMKDYGCLQAVLTPDLKKGKWILEKIIKGGASRIKPFMWIAEITRENQVRFYEDNIPRKLLTQIGRHEWSDDLKRVVQTDTGSMSLKYRVKIIDVSYKTQKLSIYITRMTSTPLTYPASLGPKLTRLNGIPTYRDYFHCPLMDSVDPATFFEIQEIGFDWISQAVRYVQKTTPCRITCAYTVLIDTINHLYRNIIEGEYPVSKRVRQKAYEIEQRAYKSIDGFIGRLLEIPQRNRMVILVSDHGAVTYRNSFNVADALKQAGLLVTRKTADGEQVVLKKSRAVYQHPAYIYVNLKGRNPGGIVEQKDYDHVADEIIAALYDYTDPKTKRKPIALALKKNDARIVGLQGDGIGDVIVAVAGGFGKIEPGEAGGQVHGFRLPGTSNGKGEMKSLFVASGPGIKKNFRLQRTMHLEDIAPTIAYIMGFAPPHQAEGAVIYQMIEKKLLDRRRCL